MNRPYGFKMFKPFNRCASFKQFADSIRHSRLDFDTITPVLQR